MACNENGYFERGGDRAGVLVIGAGVSGLTTALCLARRGFRVNILADRVAPRVTSVVAGALWEWPPAVCGHHRHEKSLARSKAWSARSYRVFDNLASDPATGVFMRFANFYFRRVLSAGDAEREKMEELANHVRGFEHDGGLVDRHGVNPSLGLVDAYRHLSPMIDTDAYLRWLMNEVLAIGCRIVNGRVTGSLVGQAPRLLRSFKAEAIVNCAGLGAAELTGDAVYPLRGALVRVRNDGRAMPRITEAHCVSQQVAGLENGFIFVVPRGEDMLVLGGIAEPHESNLSIDLHDYLPIREMHQRCVEFLPVLEQAEIDSAEPVRVGLRPARKDNVRLEIDRNAPIVHNYAHGGSGVTFSWGCAEEVVKRVGELVSHHSCTSA